MNPQGAIFHKPKSFISAKNLIYCSIFIGVLTEVLSVLLLGLKSNGGLIGIPSICIFVVTICIEIALVKMMALCKKSARTIYLIFFIIGMVGIPIYLFGMFKLSLLIATLTVVQAAMQFIAVFFLFTKESNEWFNNTTDGTLP
jgi:hypothetical protein